LFAIRITRQVNNQVVHQQLVWEVSVPVEVKDKRVALIDEIADTSEILSMAADRVTELCASEMVMVSLISHS